MYCISDSPGTTGTFSSTSTCWNLLTTIVKVPYLSGTAALGLVTVVAVSADFEDFAASAGFEEGAVATGFGCAESAVPVWEERWYVGCFDSVGPPDALSVADVGTLAVGGLAVAERFRDGVGAFLLGCDAVPDDVNSRCEVVSFETFNEEEPADTPTAVTACPAAEVEGGAAFDKLCNHAEETAGAACE